MKITSHADIGRAIRSCPQCLSAGGICGGHAHAFEAYYAGYSNALRGLPSGAKH